MKIKKQFRLFDLYRYAILGLKSQFEGIEDYDCNNDVSVIIVTFCGGGQRIYFAQNENELKDTIKHINKYNKRKS